MKYIYIYTLKKKKSNPIQSNRIRHTFGRASPRSVKVLVGSSTIWLMVSRMELAIVVTRNTLITWKNNQTYNILFNIYTTYCSIYI